MSFDRQYKSRTKPARFPQILPLETTYTLEDIRVAFEAFVSIRAAIQGIDHAYKTVNLMLARRGKAPVNPEQFARWTAFHNVLFRDIWRRKMPDVKLPTTVELTNESRP